MVHSLTSRNDGSTEGSTEGHTGSQKVELFCLSLRICLILVAFAVKPLRFCQPDGISITLLEEDVYCTILYVHRCLQQSS